MSYVVLGHAKETLHTKRKRVPKGCVLIVSEECGMKSIFPHSYYSIFSREDLRPMFEHPARYQSELEAIFQKPLKIYEPGELYPTIEYSLVSHFEDTDDTMDIMPSGIFSLPANIQDWTFHPTKRGEDSYILTSSPNRISLANLQRMYQGAVFPTRSFDSSMTLEDLQKRASVTQHTLFQLYPGVYFHFLCRALPDLEDQIESLVTSHFPGVNMSNIHTKYSFDMGANVTDWLETLTKLTEKQAKAVETITLLLQELKHRRAISGARKIQPVDRLVQLLVQKHPPSRPILRILTTLDKRLINTVDSHSRLSPLMAACFGGHSGFVKKLIDMGADYDIQDSDLVTPLMLACSLSHSRICNILLDAGCSVNMVSEDGTTALQIASTHLELRNIVRRLLHLGANPNSADEEGYTPLHSACEHDILSNASLLLSAKANIDAQTKQDGYTSLMMACKDKLETMALFLITKGADLDIRSSEGTSALGYCLKSGMESVSIRLIRKGAFVRDIHKVLQYALQQKMHTLADFIRTIQNAKGFSTEQDTANRIRFIQCAEKRKEWITTVKRCATPCKANQMRRKTLRCGKTEGFKKRSLIHI